MTIFTVFFQMLAFLLMIGVGYFITRRGMLDGHTNSQMSGLLVNVFNPLLIVSSAANAVGLISPDTMRTVGLIACGMFAVFILAGMLLSPVFERDQDQRKIFQLMFVFSNLGFIGIPVVSGIIGEEYVVYVTEFILIYTILLYTYGVGLLSRKFSLSALKEMVNPGTVLSVAALVIIIWEIQIPDFLKTAAAYLGNVTSPMALIAIGFNLAQSELKKIFGQLRLYLFAAVKLLILPLLLLPLLKAATSDIHLISVCMVMFGMPVGNIPLMLGMQKGIDVSAGSAAIILTTVLCVFTIPILMFAAAIRLRYNMKGAPRPFRLGKNGNGVMWLISGVGFIGSLTAFIFSFFPPNQISMGSNAIWFTVLIAGTVIFVALPFIILKFKKPSWDSLGTDFVPFHWDNSPGAAALRQKAAEEFAAGNSSTAPDHAKEILEYAASVNKQQTDTDKDTK